MVHKSSVILLLLMINLGDFSMLDVPCASKLVIKLMVSG
jgi:hypothetical protein